ncbi:hypothetical protein GCM10009720_09390 [Yaniella flava]|uniref:PD-(D/E)XK endonuclease-like domain-containing protein n=1 Tax=Yaniella flava TaxID=287930 RepID=A0ABN2U811_9MICC
MTQTPLKTHSLFDDLIVGYKASEGAPDGAVPAPVNGTTPAPEPDAVQPTAISDDSTTEAPLSDAPSSYEDEALAMAQFVEFRDNKMHVTDRDLVTSKIQRFKLSPSTASSLLDNCAASWAFGKMIPFDDSPFSPAGAGGLAHEALESFYELPRKQRDGVALAEEISKVVAKTFPGDAAKGSLLTQKLNQLAGGIFDLEDPKTIDVDRVEEKIEETIAGVPVTGTVDRTERVDDGDVWIGDYKTGRFKGEQYLGGYERAMRTYTLLKEAQTGIRPAGASLLYTAASHEVDIDVSDKLLEETKDDLVDAWDIHNTAIEESAFPTKAGPLCGWCPLANICETAQDAGFEPSPKAIDAGIEFIPADEEDVEVDDEHDEDLDAGHGETKPEQSTGETDTPTPQKDTMKTRPIIEELQPWELLTDTGELNPNSWAANSMFRLYSRIDEAIRNAHPDFDRDRQRSLTVLTLTDVVEVITAGVNTWTGTDSTPQDGAFTRLSHVADTYIRNAQCDFDDEAEVTSWLDELATELGFATGTVLDLFDQVMPPEDSDE